MEIQLGRNWGRGSSEHHVLCSPRYNLVPLGLSFQVIPVTTSLTPQPTPKVLGSILQQGGNRVLAGRLVELRPNCWHWMPC